MWYFTRDEEIETAQFLVEQAAADLEKQNEELKTVLSDVKNGDFIALEKELAATQTSYLIADAALDAVSRALENEELKDAAEDAFKLSETQLENVQERYEQALDTEDAEDVLEARAAIGAAQATYDTAVNQLLSLFIGDDSLQVQTTSGVVE